MVSFPAAILRELQHHLDTYPIDGPDELMFVNEHGQPWHRGKLQSGHDSPAAAVIYEHSSRVADEAIAATLDARLAERESRPVPNVVGPWRGPSEPKLIAIEPRHSRKRLLISGHP